MWLRVQRGVTPRPSTTDHVCPAHLWRRPMRRRGRNRRWWGRSSCRTCLLRTCPVTSQEALPTTGTQQSSCVGRSRPPSLLGSSTRPPMRCSISGGGRWTVVRSRRAHQLFSPHPHPLQPAMMTLASTTFPLPSPATQPAARTGASYALTSLCPLSRPMGGLALGG